MKKKVKTLSIRSETRTARSTIQKIFNNNVAGSTLTKGDNRDAQFLVLQPSMCIILNYQFIMLAFIFLLFKVVDQSLIEMFTKQSVPLN
ncbi:hypothetical protein T07_9314 [Trichinella nelsoni]|uniref:Uncharacterized protein n=1 Tax=Trichinella nelsoni TaxID=6336 RepID=A0A0V0RYJ5_9BILA|nr:hypothetical protein T07_9314 [Trichinella nelsoni]